MLLWLSEGSPSSMQRPTRIHGQLCRRRKPVQSLSGLQLRRLSSCILCPANSSFTLPIADSFGTVFVSPFCSGSFAVQVIAIGVACAGEPSIFDRQPKQLTNAHLFRRSGLSTAVFPISYIVMLCGYSSLFAEVASDGPVMATVEKMPVPHRNLLVRPSMHFTQAVCHHW
jgi:hypothetical protein